MLVGKELKVLAFSLKLDVYNGYSGVFDYVDDTLC
jgi:hypothetical protein